MTDRRVIDLFAGAGGWDEGLRRLGYEALGIDVDLWACETARAAGHERLGADLAALDPREFGPVWGLLASPPCQAWSVAGRGVGRDDRPQVIACAHELAAGSDTRAERLAACSDPRSLLTVEPLRWTLALGPRWVALEQVPPVLELWTLFAALLSTVGYETAAGVLSAEQYGVPQTRRRAFLIACLDGPVRLPAPTHRSYDPHRPDRVRDGEERLEPWVSMAAALGWSCPAVTYTNSQTHYGTRPRGLAGRSIGQPGRWIAAAATGPSSPPLVRTGVGLTAASATPRCDRRGGRRLATWRSATPTGCVSGPRRPCSATRACIPRGISRTAMTRPAATPSAAASTRSGSPSSRQLSCRGSGLTTRGRDRGPSSSPRSGTPSARPSPARCSPPRCARPRRGGRS